jgi:hypothetical protein
MPVLESTNEITPRSALRHRPIGDDTARSGKGPMIPSTGATPVVQRASRTRTKQTDVAEEINEWQYAETNDTKSGRTTAAPRQVGTTSKKLPKTPSPKAIRSKRNFWHGAHPLLYLGVGMIAMLALWTLLTMAVSWWNMTWDDIHYGRPRTFQTDAFVGHNESAGTASHFIAINLNGRVEIIEFPGGDGSKAHIYLGPQFYGTGDDLIPVTLSFIDVNGDHLPDMIIHVQSSRIVFINGQGGFRPLRPEERLPVERFLQRTGQ